MSSLWIVVWNCTPLALVLSHLRVAGRTALALALGVCAAELVLTGLAVDEGSAVLLPLFAGPAAAIVLALDGALRALRAGRSPGDVSA